MTHEEDWIEVAAAGDDEEAEIIAGLLESENIPCEIEGPSSSPWPETIEASPCNPASVRCVLLSAATTNTCRRKTGSSAEFVPSLMP